MGIISGGGIINPIEFQRAMIFVDGTNLIHRLRAAKLKITRLAPIFRPFVGGRQVVRTYFYTIAKYVEEAKSSHGPDFFDEIRIVLGEGIPTGDGNIKEKGVDALLVADLIYHAATKNYDYALIVSLDTDFTQGAKRVEDFGCRTGVLGVCGTVPERLQNACDEVFHIEQNKLIREKWAVSV